MALPLYLAMTSAEISSAATLPARCAYMACHFSPYTEGLSNIPAALPAGSVLIINDRLPCQGHSADLVAAQLAETTERLGCESVLVDFLRPPEPESEAIVSKILSTLPCPVTVTESYAKELDCPVFLSPTPLHLPLSDRLSAWNGREIWLEAALCQEEIMISAQGMSYHSIFPTEQLDGGFRDEDLYCRYRIKSESDSLRFTLYDTPESLSRKLELAGSLGVTRAVGLWQELGLSL